MSLYKKFRSYVFDNYNTAQRNYKLARACKSNRDKNCRVMSGSCHFYIVSYQCVLRYSYQRNFSHFKWEQFVKMLSKFDTTRNKYSPSSEVLLTKCLDINLIWFYLFIGRQGLVFIFPDIRCYSRSQLTMHPGLSVFFTSKQKHTEVIKSSERLTVGL